MADPTTETNGRKFRPIFYDLKPPPQKTHSNINSSRIQLYGFNKRGLEVITWPAPNPKIKGSEGLEVLDKITRPLPTNKVISNREWYHLYGA